MFTHLCMQVYYIGMPIYMCVQMYNKCVLQVSKTCANIPCMAMCVPMP